jgi:DNA-binding MarR family transcriptional regulator
MKPSERIKELRKMGVTGGTHLCVLLECAERKRTRISDLARAAGVSNASVTQTVDKMIEKGLRTRENGKDRRCGECGLTDLGALTILPLHSLLEGGGPE